VSFTELGEGEKGLVFAHDYKKKWIGEKSQPRRISRKGRRRKEE